MDATTWVPLLLAAAGWVYSAGAQGRTLKDLRQRVQELEAAQDQALTSSHQDRLALVQELAAIRTNVQLATEGHKEMRRHVREIYRRLNLRQADQPPPDGQERRGN